MSETLTDQQRHAHARATRQGIAAKAVGRWARGEDVPRVQAATNLQNALHVVELLRSQEDDETIRSWFRGMNPNLCDGSPALLIRDQPEAVIQAARAFLAH